jgi:hypothetical protein
VAAAPVPASVAAASSDSHMGSAALAAPPVAAIPLDAVPLAAAYLTAASLAAALSVTVTILIFSPESRKTEVDLKDGALVSCGNNL